MIFYYLDASAWVKRYYWESGTRWVQDLFAQNPAIACASLGLIEVMAPLARKRKARDIDLLSFQQKAQELEEDWMDFIQIQLTAETINRTKDLARDMALRGAAAVHLASALVLQSRLVDAEDRLIFVAADRELKEALKRPVWLSSIQKNKSDRRCPMLGMEPRKKTKHSRTLVNSGIQHPLSGSHSLLNL